MAYGRSEQAYVIDLCDEILGEEASREHRFDWLLGDPGRNGRKPAKLPVDAFYPGHGLVVEYWERQHDEAVTFFDKPDWKTVSGVSRGEQRAIYDRRRAEVIPRRGLRLVLVRATQLSVNTRGRLTLDTEHDRAALRELLSTA